VTVAIDPVQRLSEAIVAIVNASAAVQALTGTSTDSVVRWKRRRKMLAAGSPRLAYLAGPATIAGGLGETYDVDVTMRAVATNARDANALLRTSVEALTPNAFEGQDCDAVVLDTTYDNPADDDGESAADAAAVIAEVDLVINLTM
jgi:hypothetical protein